MTVIAAAPPSRPIPVERAHSLFRWNALLAALHGVQFVAMLALSLAQDPMARWPIISSYLTFDTATSTRVRSAWSALAAAPMAEPSVDGIVYRPSLMA